MSLLDVRGQGRAVAMLRGIITNRRVASSYLFAGEAGIGKKMAALNFVKALNCTGNGMPYGVEDAEDAGAMLFAADLPAAVGDGTADACDACSSCMKIDEGVHPDVVLIAPTDRQIRIEEIRTIDEALSFRPYEGRVKAVIVDDAEAMNSAAANAFLKTLEEPPAHSVIVLVSSRPELLPATIRSRCSRVNFTPLPAAACREVLGSKVDDERLELLVRLSMGRPGNALAADLAEERGWFFDLLRSMLAAEKDGWASREDMERWFDGLVVLLRDLAALKIDSTTALVSDDMRSELEQLGKSADLKGIIYLYRECALLKGMLMFNLNKSITWNYMAALLRRELAV